MFSSPLLIAVLIIAGMAAGWFLARRQQPISAPPPQPLRATDFTLQARAMVNHSEAIIWRWMLSTFPNHRVLVKLPFSRFTIPTNPEMMRAQYEMFNGLYATFTITDRNGKVLGCIDMASSRETGLNSSQRTKQEILAKLGIAYETIRGAEMPSPATLRLVILHGRDDNAHAGKSASTTETDHAQLLDARSQLLELLDRQRDRRVDFRPSYLADLSHDAPPSTLWQSP